MGVVSGEINFLDRYKGCGHYSHALYIYCDRCGSFQIGKRIGKRQFIILFLDTVFYLTILILVFYGIISFIFVSFIIAIIGISMNIWGLLNYYCKDCKSGTSTRYNTRNLPSKIYLENKDKGYPLERIYYSYWDYDIDLEEYIKMPSEKK